MRTPYSTSSLNNLSDTYQSRKSYTRRAGLRAFTPLDASPEFNSASIRTSSATSEEGSQYFYSAASSSFSSLPSTSRRSSIFLEDDNDSDNDEESRPLKLPPTSNDAAANTTTDNSNDGNEKANGTIATKLDNGFLDEVIQGVPVVSTPELSHQTATTIDSTHDDAINGGHTSTFPYTPPPAHSQQQQLLLQTTFQANNSPININDGKFGFEGAQNGSSSLISRSNNGSIASGVSSSINKNNSAFSHASDGDGLGRMDPNMDFHGIYGGYDFVSGAADSTNSSSSVFGRSSLQYQRQLQVQPQQQQRAPRRSPSAPIHPQSYYRQSIFPHRGPATPASDMHSPPIPSAIPGSPPSSPILEDVQGPMSKKATRIHLQSGDYEDADANNAQHLYPGGGYPLNKYLQQLQLQQQQQQQHKRQPLDRYQFMHPNVQYSDDGSAREYPHNYRTLHPSATTPSFTKWKGSRSPSYANNSSGGISDGSQKEAVIYETQSGQISDFSENRTENKSQRPSQPSDISMHHQQEPEAIKTNGNRTTQFKLPSENEKPKDKATLAESRSRKPSTTLLPPNSTTIYIPTENSPHTSPNQLDMHASNYSFVPKNIQCTKCRRYSPINYEYRVSKEWAMVSLLLLVVFMPVFWIPLVNKKCKHMMYVCEYCKSTIRRAPLADEAMEAMNARDRKQRKKQKKPKRSWLHTFSKSNVDADGGDDQSPDEMNEQDRDEETFDTNKSSMYTQTPVYPRKKHRRRRLLSFHF